jgi:hypothetical protein
MTERSNSPDSHFRDPHRGALQSSRISQQNYPTEKIALSCCDRDGLLSACHSPADRIDHVDDLTMGVLPGDAHAASASGFCRRNEKSSLVFVGKSLHTPTSLTGFCRHLSQDRRGKTSPTSRQRPTFASRSVTAFRRSPHVGHFSTRSQKARVSSGVLAERGGERRVGSSWSHVAGHRMRLQPCPTCSRHCPFHLSHRRHIEGHDFRAAERRR